MACPLEGKCIQTNVIYQATPNKKTTTKTAGLTLLNVTVTTLDPFGARIEEMKQNSQNMFGLQF